MIVCRLSKLMKDNNKTQSEISSKTGITRPTLLSLIRNDNQSIKYETIDKLCNFFDIDMSELLVYSPVPVKLKDIRIDKIPLSLSGEINMDQSSFIVSLIYEIDGKSFEFDTNLQVTQKDNNLRYSGKLFFSSLLYNDEWKILKNKHFNKDFLKVYNESINFEELIKSKLHENNLNTDFKIKTYNIDIATMERSKKSTQELFNDLEKTLQNLPISREEKEALLNSIKSRY
ncbi:helix-turn-helix domain-containing protein [Staphylococcus pseudintermedius]|uniref:helix-turn-helix domain-containing protein n=1 Tax=Staphylococcus pseudintermedius TaxID=283734 RepID=UPI002566CBC3|nr:helix-turn-helix transcriptional regulator [Staphylococcus pseudintermedius]